ncbi:MAG: hypothetical protein LBI75_01090 [Brucellaceae bacterium]|jgi:hypothetical protein|nr:hypothetical protein [Brucellaceae bacterium]
MDYHIKNTTTGKYMVLGDSTYVNGFHSVELIENINKLNFSTRWKIKLSDNIVSDDIYQIFSSDNTMYLIDGFDPNIAGSGYTIKQVNATEKNIWIN